MKFKKLICGALIVTSLICGVGCTPKTNIEKETETIVTKYETRSKQFYRGSGSNPTIEVQINEWLSKNPNVEIVFMDYEDPEGSWNETALIIYRILKGE